MRREDYNLELSPKAQDELYDSWVWYEKISVGLGDRFEDSFYKKAGSVRLYPEHYPAKNNYRNKTYREALLEDFPFIIVYNIIEEEKLIYVVSIFHTSRHPKRKFK